MGPTRKFQNTSLGKSLMKKGSKQPAWGSKQYTDPHSQGDTSSASALKSVTQETSYEEFIATAALADKEFTAEKLNVKFVSLSAHDPEENLLSSAEQALVVVPRRPKWTKEMTAEELDEAEKEAFLGWRRHMAGLQEKDGITPFERNIEVWRQLWRVIEKSHIIVQIVDGRNPLLYRCNDLEAYVKEMDKRNVLLINKADFLTQSQRLHWSTYFDSISLPHAYYSAATENELVSKMNKETIDEEGTSASEHSSEESEDDDDEVVQPHRPVVVEDTDRNVTNVNAKPVLNRVELIEFLKGFKSPEEQQSSDLFIVGFCGHPNVGKSSTINSLMASKKTSVSSTPGKTKHFQTLFLTGLEDELMLCDCPGLVMPSFGGSQGEMVLGGILPIDTLTNYNPGVKLLSERIPKAVMEKKYGISLPQEYSHSDVLSSYASIRGFMTVRGIPDESRAARIFLKDYVNGKLLYCHAPPTVEQSEFAPTTMRSEVRVLNKPATDDTTTTTTVVVEKTKEPTLKKVNVEGNLDAAFFSGHAATAHIKGRRVIGVSNAGGGGDLKVGDGDKPWRKQSKRNTKEKLRRVYRHLDVD